MVSAFQITDQSRGSGAGDDEIAVSSPAFEHGSFRIVEFSPAWERHVRRQIIILPLTGAGFAAMAIAATAFASQGSGALAICCGLLAFLCGFICTGAWAEVLMAFRRERHNAQMAVCLLERLSKEGGARHDATAGERGNSPAVGEGEAQ